MENNRSSTRWRCTGSPMMPSDSVSTTQPTDHLLYRLTALHRLLPCHAQIMPCVCSTDYIYRMSQEERTKLREVVPYVKLYRYNPKHLHYTKLNGYGDNGKRSLKLWQLLHTYWLPNSYWNWQEYVVSIMLISVLNIKVTCEWHKAIKLNHKNTRTHISVVLRVTKHCTYRQ